MRHLILGGVLAVITSVQPALARAADVTKAVPDAALLQANISLQAMQQLTSRRTYKDLGFTSPEEVKAATLGAPLRIFMVRLDKLKEYAGSMDPRELLEDTNAVRYPVYVGKTARSGIVVREVGKEWQMESIGSPALTKALVSAARREEKAGASAAPQFVVNIPALNLYFVGLVEGSELTLSSAIDDPQFDLVAGKAVPAKDLFERLAAHAKQVETGPRVVD